MKLKKTKLLFLLALLTLLPIIAMNSNAIECYDVNISQTKGKTVTVTVEVVDMVREEEIISAVLSHTIDGVLQSPVFPEKNIPTRDNTVTFVIGPFRNGDKIVYDVHLDFGIATCDDYQSKSFSFTIGFPLWIIALIIGIAIVGIAILSYVWFGKWR